MRRDEAQARAQQQQDERDRRDAESSQRLRALRGETIVDEDSFRAAERDYNESDHEHRRTAKRTRRELGHGEKEWDAAYRNAEIYENSSRSGGGLEGKGALLHKERRRDGGVEGTKRLRTSQTPATDLLPIPSSVQKATPTSGANAEKEPGFGNLANMRFIDAAGRSNGTSRSSGPWYAGASSHHGGSDSVGKDVWGREDVGRADRDLKRLQNNDPLKVMKQGAQAVRRIEQQREEWRRERERDVGVNMAKDEDRLERRKRRREWDKRGRESDGDDETKSERKRPRERQNNRDRDAQRRSTSMHYQPDGRGQHRRHHHHHRSRHGSRSPERILRRDKLRD